jgi:hypothetical protein
MSTVFEHLGKAEQQAVMKHRELLAAEQGRDVSIETALADWTERRAAAWRTRRQAAMLELQRQEILRHKWIESEKARRDLGSEAVFDWIAHHAASWRQWYESECEVKEV